MYIIYKDGVEVNRIVADEAFCEQYYSQDGYSYEEEPPAPEPEPVDQASLPPTVEQLQAKITMLEAQQTFLEDCILEMADEVYA